MEIVERQFDKIGQVVSSISAPSVQNVVSTSTNPPVNSVVSAWQENNSMFNIVESALQAYERAKKIPDNEAFFEIALARYKKALNAYKSMFGDDSGLLGQV